jgi:hypothetical protein
MNDVADVNPDLDLNLPARRRVGIAMCQGALDGDGAFRRRQRTLKFDQESVADGFDLRAVEFRENLPENLSMFLE